MQRNRLLHSERDTANGAQQISESYWMTTKDLAAEGIQSVPKSNRDRKSGVGFPFYYHGRKVLYKRSEVYAAIESGRAKSTQDKGGAHAL